MMKLVAWAQAVVTFHGNAAGHLEGLHYLPAASGAGDDVIPVIPVLPAGTHLECAGGVSESAISDCPRPSLTGRFIICLMPRCAEVSSAI